MDNWLASPFSRPFEGRTATRFGLQIAFILCLPALLFAQLPAGSGWSPLPNTQMINSCPANNPQGACGNAACTTYQEFDYQTTCNSIILPWSGGVGDDLNQRLYVFGGGHADYGGNQLMALDLRGTPSWEVFYSPDKVAYPTDGQGLVPNWESYNPYIETGDTQHYPPSGGSPSSRHTYFGLAFSPAQNALYSFGGSTYHLGDNSPEAWALNASTRTWQLLAPYGNGYMGAVALNPNTGHFIGYDGQYNIYDYNPVSHTRTTLSTNIPASAGQNWGAAVDPIDNLFIFITGNQYPLGYIYNTGPPTVGYIRGYNLNNGTPIIWDNPSCNGAPLYQAMGLEWDSALGLLVGYPSFGNQILLLNSQPNPVVTNYGTVPSHQCLQVTIGSTPGVDYPPGSNDPSGYTGGFGRFRYFPSLDIFVNVNDASNNAWILRLNDVPVPGFTLSAVPAALSVVQGTQGTSTITSAISGGFNSSVSLTATGTPAGTTVSFNPSTLPAPGSGNSTMTLTVGASTPVGTYPITVTGTGGGVRQTATVTLTVTSNQPTLTVSASPTALTVVQGTQGMSTITTAVGGGFDNPVALTATGAPAGTTISFNPSTLPAPGSGTSTMMVTVGTSTPAGTYPITVKAAGGSLAPTTTVSLTVSPGSSGWQQGFDFRATAGYVTDPANTTHVLATMAYPTTVGGVTFGWANTALIASRDRSTTVDPRLAGINYARNGSPGKFYVTLPSAGSYNLSLAMGDEGYSQCWVLCQVQFLDGSTVLGTVTGNPLIANFEDAKGNTWTAAAWPGSNLALPVTLAGTQLTVVVGTNNSTGDITPIAYLGLSQAGGGGSPNFTLSASPAALSVEQGTQGTSTITSTISGGFNSAVALTATGAPAGTTVSFNPSTLPAPGSGNSTMTVIVGSSTPVGTYPITVTGTGGGIRQTATVTLTVTADPPTLTVSASPASLTVVQGTQGTSTITTAGSGGFNNTVALSATGAPVGTTVSFNPSTIPAPGSGNSTMTVTVGASTPAGTYPITVKAAGGGLAPTTTVNLTVSSGWQQGFDFRATAGYVTDPANTTHVLATMAYPTTVGGVTFGWANTALIASRDRSATVDPRLAGINYARNGSPGKFYVTLPSAGSYNLSLAMGDEGYSQCWVQCQVQFLDGSTVLGTVTGNPLIANFEDAKGNTWTAAAWPGSNLALPVTLAGTQLTVVVGTNNPTGDITPIAYLGLSQGGAGGSPNFTISAAPASLSVAQGTQGTSTITSTISGGFNSAVALTSAGAPAGTTISFNPSTIPAPGSGNSTMTVTVGSSTPTGTYPITVTGTGGGIRQTATVTLTVTSTSPTLTVVASPTALTIVQGTQGTSTITTAVGGGFNNAVALSAAGAPAGTTVSFNPSTIPAPGSGNSTMTVTVGASTPVGTYPITVTAAGGGLAPTTTVTLTVTANQPTLTVTASPTGLTIVQGTQGTSTITTAVGGGFNSTVALSAAGAPAGTTVSFNPSTIPAPGSGNSTMTVTVGASTPTGTYPITVTAAGGSLAPTTTVTLTVTSSGGGGGSGNGITVSDLTGNGQTNRFISVGRFFKQGDIPNFAQAVVGGAPILTQCDVKNRWPDGSLKFAIVSFVLPSVSTAGTPVSFQNQGTGNNTGYLQQDDMLNSAYDFEAVMQLNGTVSPSISARSMLQNGLFRYWLQGPIVTAVIIEDREGRSADVNTDGGTGNPLHPIFEAWFYPQGTKVQVGFTLEDTWASSTATQSARNQTFALNLLTGYNSPATRLSQPTFTQWAFTRWHRAFWVDSDPPAVQYNWNPQYLLTTGAYPNWDLTYMPPASSIAAEYATYTNLQTQFPARFTIPGFDDPNNGGVINYNEAIDAAGEGTHGDWIGLTSSWDTIYLLTGNPNVQKMTIDNADFAARFPMWFREADHNAGSGHYFDEPGNGSVDPYGHVVSVNARQQVTLYLSNWTSNNSLQGCGGTEYEDAVYTNAIPSHGGWPAMGTSHLPDFGYIPYSLTGQYYYLEQEQLEAGYVIAGLEGCYNLSLGSMGWRQGYLGLQTGLVRDTAWTLRTIAYGSFISPDDSPEQAYLADKLMNNLAMQEGAHGLTMTVPVTTGSSAAYSYGKNTLRQTQAAYPSPQGAWQLDSASQNYAQNGSENNVNSSTLSNAGAPWQEAFLAATFGMTRQFGLTDTTSLLGFMAIRPINEVLNPVLNRYLVGQYVYPSTLITGGLGPQGWIPDWPTFQNNYLVLPTSWECGTSDSGRSAMQLGILSYMIQNTVNGYSGQTAWSWLKNNFSCQSSIYPNDPRWSMIPLH